MQFLLRTAKAAIDFFLFSSLFLALCAVAMVHLAYVLFHIPGNSSFLWFVFWGTLTSYNLHWYLTPSAYGGSYKTAWSYRNKRLHLALFITGLVGSVVYLLHLLPHWRWLLVTAFLTFLYTAPKVPHPLFEKLKKIAVGKTIFLAYAWTHITAFLPLALHQDVLSDGHIFYVVNRFFLLYAICILFDYRDREMDKHEGIRSMIIDLNEKGVGIVFSGTLVAFAGTGILLHTFGFTPLQLTALYLPGAFVAGLYKVAKRNTSDYLYYFGLDGLMMFSYPLLLIFSF